VEAAREGARIGALHRRGDDLRTAQAPQQYIPQYIQQPQAPAVVPVFPSGIGGSGGGVNGKGGINIKVSTTSKAIINEKTKRRKVLTKAKRVYNTIKKLTIKAIKLGKDAHYKLESEKIKNLPVKQRKAARAKLRAMLKKRESDLISKLPASSKMKLNDLKRVSMIARKLKW
jgi:hypothetical protein